MLCKDKENSVILGVCSGLALYLGCDPFWVRLGFVVGFLNFGIGVLLYIVLGLLMPNKCNDK